MTKPILFNTEMVKALLNGRKTVTRRVVKPQPSINASWLDKCAGTYTFSDATFPHEPFSKGDILYVRETWAEVSDLFGEFPQPIYKADIKDDHDYDLLGGVKWRPSIHMPREAARIFLHVTNVRVERLHDITPDSCAMEGIELYSGPVGSREAYYKREFAKLWNSTIPQKDSQSLSWGNNPWVWVIEFERCEKP